MAFALYCIAFCYVSALMANKRYKFNVIWPISFSTLLRYFTKPFFTSNKCTRKKNCHLSSFEINGYRKTDNLLFLTTQFNYKIQNFCSAKLLILVIERCYWTVTEDWAKSCYKLTRKKMYTAWWHDLNDLTVQLHCKANITF